ncbi:HTH-type transcriptional regulator YesS [compost metagenome]
MTEYIHKHYAEDITLELLASQLYISKNYLNQLFKKVTGETFTNYVIRVRIEKAKTLLQGGSYLIYEVSEMVGYQNVPYFSTLFKKYCGVSPSELMKR